MPLLQSARVPDIPEDNLEPLSTTLSLDAWVEREKRTCSHSRAEEAASRIRAMQRDKSKLLNLRNLHLHSVPPLIGCQHVTSYLLAINCLMRVPDDLGELPNLTWLGLGTNGLRRIPSFRKYSKLSIVDVNGNPIEEGPRQVPGRPVGVAGSDTLLTDYSRKRYRSGQRRLRLREFIARTFPYIPSSWLPPLKEECPTFDGGEACDLKLRPFPFRTGNEEK